MTTKLHKNSPKDKACLHFTLLDSLLVSAGVAEVVFGLCVFIYFRVRWVIYLNILALTGLLMLVALLYPVVLIDAFNPVTTNITLIALSLILLNSLNQKKG